MSAATLVQAWTEESWSFRGAGPARSAGLRGRLYRHGVGDGAPGSGIAWLDEAGVDEVEVRLQRVLGPAPRVPDIRALSLRVHHDDGASDLLLRCTLGEHVRRMLPALPDLLGAARVGARAAGWSGARSGEPCPRLTSAPYCPGDGVGEQIVLSAVGRGVETYELAWSRLGGERHAFGVLRLSSVPVSGGAPFDPVRHPLPGLRPRTRPVPEESTPH